MPPLSSREGWLRSRRWVFDAIPSFVEMFKGCTQRWATATIATRTSWTTCTRRTETQMTADTVSTTTITSSTLMGPRPPSSPRSSWCHGARTAARSRRRCSTARALTPSSEVCVINEKIVSSRFQENILTKYHFQHLSVFTKWCRLTTKVNVSR